MPQSTPPLKSLKKLQLKKPVLKLPPKDSTSQSPPEELHSPASSIPPSSPLKNPLLKRVLPSAFKGAAAFAAATVKEVKRKQGLRKGAPSVCQVLSDGGILSEVTEYIPTGFEGIDAILGGGVPVGRSSEVFGPEAAGKSAFARACARGVQSLGGIAVIIDYELSTDSEKVASEGLDPDRIIYETPETIEEGLNILRDKLDYFEKRKPNFPILIVWDSIAAAIARAELEEDNADDAHVGVQARAMGKLFRSTVRRIAKNRIHMMFVNQERDKIGGYSKGGYKPTDTPGGRAAKFFSTVRLRCTKIGTYKSGTTPAGFDLRITSVKNKHFPPLQRADWLIDFDYGPSPELVTLKALMLGRHVVSGDGKYSPVKWFDIDPMTREEWIATMRNNDEFREKARALSVEVTRKRATAPTVGIVEDD